MARPVPLQPPTSPVTAAGCCCWDRGGRIKPCGGAIPPKLVRDFGIPEHLLVAKVSGARIISPSEKQSDMPIDGGGYVAMVDREEFDEWLRERAVAAGAERRTGTYDRISHDDDGVAVVHFALKDGTGEQRVRTRVVIGADGARSVVAKQCVKGGRSRALRVRLSRDRPVPTERPGVRWLSLRRVLPRHVVTRFLRLDLPARRHDEHRHRLRQEGLRSTPGHHRLARAHRAGRPRDGAA